jgi:hypothetical protein
MRAGGWRKPTQEQVIRALLKAHPLKAIQLPSAASSSDNSELCCSLDQGSLGSCQTNTVAQTFFMEQTREGVFQPFIASRLAGYFWNRNRDGNADEDVGATIGGSYEVFADMGVPAESAWPYLIENFAVRPYPSVDRDAFDRKGTVGINYFPIHEFGDSLISTMEQVLSSGRGVSFGVAVSESFCSTPPTGIIQPPTSKDVIAGGHALTVVGHNRAQGWGLVKNSWSDAWGEKGLPPGCCRMSYSYLAMASDCWFCGLSTGGLR